MNIAWTETAASQLAGIRDYVAWSSPGYGRAIASRVVSRTRILGDSPFLGSEVSEYGDPSIREIYEHPYRILYFLPGSEVQILAVIHSSRQLPRIPPL